MIDWARVGELRSEVGEENFQEVVEVFLEEVDEIAFKLAESPDPGQFVESLHFLKGSALNLGFRRLSEICTKGEKEASAGKFAVSDLGEVLKVYKDSKADFLEKLKLS